jgi:hypothetical protein
MPGIWIRSQGKKYLGFYNECLVMCNEVYGRANRENDSTLLGEYESKERAMQVLDEIQNQITTSLTYTANVSNYERATSAYVYEMPAE